MDPNSPYSSKRSGERPNEEPQRGILQAARDCADPALGQALKDTNSQAGEQLHRFPKQGNQVSHLEVFFFPYQHDNTLDNSGAARRWGRLLESCQFGGG